MAGNARSTIKVSRDPAGDWRVMFRLPSGVWLALPGRFRSRAAARAHRRAAAEFMRTSGLLAMGR